jgi:hypothetical protein
MRFGRIAAVFAGAVAIAAAPLQIVWAHHSFAVFFSSDKDVTPITGVVKEYHFTNPHGIIEIIVPGKGGPDQDWKVETNSPSILIRRGWSKDSLKPGDVVTVHGWPARDGSKYMRLRDAQRADGSPIGTPGPAVQ